ncbi:MAG: hypothetical protein U1F50_08895 [Rubrivivax sp.]
MRRLLVIAVAASASLLAGCDMLGIESASAVAARKEAEGKAVGGACRNAGRGIEDCFALNKKADKAAVFAGWREMNDYMRENKMDVVPAAAAAAPAADKAAEKSPEKGGEKKAAKADAGAHGHDS